MKLYLEVANANELQQLESILFQQEYDEHPQIEEIEVHNCIENKFYYYGIKKLNLNNMYYIVTKEPNKLKNLFDFSD